MVLDASSYVPMVLKGEIPLGLRRYELVGPPLLWSETVSALREAAYRQVVSEDLARTAVERLHTMGVELVTDKRLAATAFGIATDLGWAKTYDAEYVALARLLECRLLTLDARLARGAGRMAEIVTPTELER
jgi:predicted nucleic acid-binding protein